MSEMKPVKGVTVKELKEYLANYKDDEQEAAE